MICATVRANTRVALYASHENVSMRTRLLEQPDPARARCAGKANGLRQLYDGPTSVALQLVKDSPVQPVEIHICFTYNYTIIRD